MYHEPFPDIGGVLLDLRGSDRMRRGTASATAINSDLIGTWTRIRDQIHAGPQTKGGTPTTESIARPTTVPRRRG